MVAGGIRGIVNPAGIRCRGGYAVEQRRQKEANPPKYENYLMYSIGESKMHQKRLPNKCKYMSTRWDRGGPKSLR